MRCGALRGAWRSSVFGTLSLPVLPEGSWGRLRYMVWIYDPDKFKVTGGEIALCATSPGVERGFCGKCGTSLTYAGEGWDTIAITTTTLDEPSIAKPTRNVYLDHQQPWVALDESLKQSRKFPE
jgi:hypothetical protein